MSNLKNVKKRDIDRLLMLLYEDRDKQNLIDMIKKSLVGVDVDSVIEASLGYGFIERVKTWAVKLTDKGRAHLVAGGFKGKKRSAVVASLSTRALGVVQSVIISGVSAAVGALVTYLLMSR